MGEMDKFVIWCGISSGFLVPEIIKIGSFLMSYLQNNGDIFWTMVYNAYCKLIDFGLMCLSCGNLL